MRVSVLCAAVLAASPAFAATYSFDYSLGSSSGGNYYDYSSGSYSTGDLRVVGTVETDDTMGVIDHSNIVSWEFTISGASGSQTISSAMNFGQITHLWGSFEATAESLSAIGDYTFAERYVAVDENNYLIQWDVGRIRGRTGTDRVNGDIAYYYNYGRECTIITGTLVSDCSAADVDGEYAVNLSDETLFSQRGSLNTEFVGQIISTPLPAGALLLITGMGGLAALRRRRRAA